MDTGHDGFISYEELKKALMQSTEEFTNTSEDDWEEILCSMDTNNDGKIDFPEFVAAAYDR
jgi:Ca2+-binding EF-hand superfamily protein